MTFFTTGLFELYAIKRTGPLEFCDDGTKLTVNGLDRVQTLFVEGAFLQFGEREPRQSFAPGEMPAALQKIHNFDIRMVSSEHK